MKQENNIENWSLFGVQNVRIHVHELEIDGETRYNPVIAFILNDGTLAEEDINEDNMKVIHLTTDHFCTNPKHAVFETAMGLGKMFSSIGAAVDRYDNKGNLVETYDLNEEFEEFYDEDYQEEKIKKIIHWGK